MPRINILDKSVAELIAAGEVVERPASVIKELVENSIDAGATNVTIEIQNGGITYMRVTDNGCGIYSDDVQKAFISHATSKVKCSDDLNGIFTLGFRGEALPSIASVSRTEVLTKNADEQTGTRYVIEGGKEITKDVAGCPCGTTIVVRDIFFNTPARMKFLKKDVSEGNAVSAVVDRIALSHPEISFRFIRDGKQVLVTSGNGQLSSCAYTVLGRDVSQTLIPVEYTLDGIRVNGLVSKPAGSRATRSMQFFYLNNRYIKSKTIMAALEEGYKGTVMTGRFPACVLNVFVNAQTVDVNVHPAKTEVRFSDERKIFSAVYYGVKSSITQSDTRVQADLSGLKNSVPTPSMPVAEQIKISTEKAAAFLNSFVDTDEIISNALKVSSPKPENPFKKTERHENSVNIEPKFSVTPVTEYYSTATQQNINDDTDNREAAVPTTEIDNYTTKDIELKYIGEAFKTYIIVEVDKKLIFIDKHAAHERMIYEQIKNNKEHSTQILMSPVTVTLSKSEYSAITENTKLLYDSGYAVEDFGNGTVIVRECPMYIDYGEIPAMIQEIAGYIESSKNNLNTEKLDWILHNTACRAAIKAGDKTSAYELEDFAKRILTDDSIRYCPHGRPVLFELSRTELEKMFGRIQ